jgi:hypothetical protein
LKLPHFDPKPQFCCCGNIGIQLLDLKLLLLCSYIKNNIDLGLLMIFLRLKARKLSNKNYSIEWSLKKVFNFFRESMAVFEYLQLEQFPQNDQVQQFSV